MSTLTCYTLATNYPALHYKTPKDYGKFIADSQLGQAYTTKAIESSASLQTANSNSSATHIFYIYRAISLCLIIGSYNNIQYSNHLTGITYS